MKQTRRVGIEHLQKMKPIAFIKLMKAFDETFKGVITKQDVHITEKIDGSSLRFGMTSKGSIFIETSNSGVITDDGGYTAYAKSRGYEPNKITRNFDALLSEIKKDVRLKSLLKKYVKNGGVKIIGELLYVPMASEIDDNNVKFIKIKYDRNKLGTHWTFVPFAVVDEENETHEDESKIIDALLKISTKERSYIKPKLKMDRSIDLTLPIKQLYAAIDGIDDLEQLLVSRKKIDREMKLKLKDEIGQMQQDVAKTITKHISQGALGDDYEGVVIKTSDGKYTFKIITDTFKDATFDFNVNESVILINEGGNAIDGVVPVNQENAMATVDDIVKTLVKSMGLERKHIGMLGSTGKKAPKAKSGDIDIALDGKELLKQTGVDTYEEVLTHIYDIAVKAGHKARILKGIGIVTVGYPIKNEDGEQPDEIVQLDFMVVDSVKYAEWGFYSPSYLESDLKGLYRNELLFAAARYADFKVLKKAFDKEGSEVPVEWERTRFTNGQGLLRAVQNRVGKKGNVIKGIKTTKISTMTQDPDVVVQYLFGPKVTDAKKILTFDQALAAVMSKDFPYKSARNDILTMTAKGIEVKGYPIPKSLKKLVRGGVSVKNESTIHTTIQQPPDETTKMLNEDSKIFTKTLVFAFGRANPPTPGHIKLFDAVAKEAKRVKGDAMIVLTKTQEKRKNPLPFREKVSFAKQIAPKHSKLFSMDESLKTFFDVVKQANDSGKYDSIIMVAGSDRVKEFEMLLKRYADDYDNIDAYKVVSAGSRDPDAEGVEGMSASKIRALVADGNIDEFMDSYPMVKSDHVLKRLFDHIAKGMGVSDSKQLISEAAVVKNTGESERDKNSSADMHDDDKELKVGGKEQVEIGDAGSYQPGGTGVMLYEGKWMMPVAGMTVSTAEGFTGTVTAVVAKKQIIHMMTDGGKRIQVTFDSIITLA